MANYDLDAFVFRLENGVLRIDQTPNKKAMLLHHPIPGQSLPNVHKWSKNQKLELLRRLAFSQNSSDVISIHHSKVPKHHLCCLALEGKNVVRMALWICPTCLTGKTVYRPAETPQYCENGHRMKHTDAWQSTWRKDKVIIETTTR